MMDLDYLPTNVIYNTYTPNNWIDECINPDAKSEARGMSFSFLGPVSESTKESIKAMLFKAQFKPVPPAPEPAVKKPAKLVVKKQTKLTSSNSLNSGATPLTREVIESELRTLMPGLYLKDMRQYAKRLSPIICVPYKSGTTRNGTINWFVANYEKIKPNLSTVQIMIQSGN